MRLAWLTDLHLDFLSPSELQSFLDSLASSDADAFVITGDIGQARVLVTYLESVVRAVWRPVYFVLGNHDFYHSSVGEVRRRVRQVCGQDERLVYLSECGCVELTPDVALVGHDGWADLQFGDFEHSTVLLNDYLLIGDLKRQTKSGLREVTGGFAREAAGHFHALLPQAASRYRQVYIATHVPPFREACWYNGRISDDNWLPHMSSKAAGEALRGVMEHHTQCQATVLCGHTHNGAEVDILPNLRILTGEAHYGRPAIQRTFDLRRS